MNDKAMLAERDCPACEAADCTSLPQFSRDGWRVVSCAGCGFVYLRNAPEYELLVEEFAWEKTYQAEKVRRRSDGALFRALDRATSWRTALKRDAGARYRKVFGSGRVLDVGCGGGEVLPEPLIPFGIEISAGLHAVADAVMRRRGGYAVHAPGIEGLKTFDDGFFDGVLMSSILEHEKDPKALLAGVHRVLKTGGKLYLRQPNYGCTNRKVMGAKWCGFRYPDHVNYFRVSDLERMAHETGFSFRHLNRFAPCADNMHALLTKA
jgi:SAM-dependent methyltransferase